MTTLEKPRILQVDDHAAVRHGLAMVLEEEGVGECREAAGRDEALAAAAGELPDLALVDLSPGTDDALKLVAELCARNVPVLICSTHEEPGHVRGRWRQAPAATSPSARRRGSWHARCVMCWTAGC